MVNKNSSNSLAFGRWLQTKIVLATQSSIRRSERKVWEKKTSVRQCEHISLNWFDSFVQFFANISCHWSFQMVAAAQLKYVRIHNSAASSRATIMIVMTSLMLLMMMMFKLFAKKFFLCQSISFFPLRLKLGHIGFGLS